MRTSRRTGVPHTLVLAVLALVLLAGPALAEVYYWGDGTPDGKRSIGGGGHLVFFDAGPDGRWLNSVEMFGSRYGGGQPPAEDFHLYIVDINRAILAEVALPYSLWERGPEYWRDLPIPTKGVFIGIDTGASYSYSWVPGVEGQWTEDFNWMVRATVDGEPFGDPNARELIVLADGTAFFDTVEAVTDDGSALQTAGQGEIATADIVSVRFDAFRLSVAGGVTVHLTTGAIMQGEIIGIDDDGVHLSVGGQERTISKGMISRIEF